MSIEDLDNRFKFHPATDKTGPQHDDVRGLCRQLALLLNDKLPEGREKAVVFTKLEEVMFWANAAIARNP